jgi:hypothetical protein
MTRSSRIGRRFTTLLLLVVALTAVLSLVSSGAAFADAATHASCIGHEASGISPKGSSDEFPGGMPQIHAVVTEAFPGVPYGAIISTVAKIHAGSHEACDEATE